MRILLPLEMKKSALSIFYLFLMKEIKLKKRIQAIKENPKLFDEEIVLEVWK